MNPSENANYFPALYKNMAIQVAKAFEHAAISVKKSFLQKTFKQCDCHSRLFFI